MVLYIADSNRQVKSAVSHMGGGTVVALGRWYPESIAAVHTPTVPTRLLGLPGTDSAPIFWAICISERGMQACSSGQLLTGVPAQAAPTYLPALFLEFERPLMAADSP